MTGENPLYGPGNPDWEHDRSRDDDAARDVDIGACQSCGRYLDASVYRVCPCGGYVG